MVVMAVTCAGIAVDGDTQNGEGPKEMVLLKKSGKVAYLEKEISGWW
jgi:hypothetical protein